MSTIEDIQKAIAKLSANDQSRLLNWLEQQDSLAFDERLQRDADSGKLEKLAASARANMAAGLGEEF
jgi:hypothetical protein